MRILLTEDEEGIISFMTKGLRSAGYAVDVARTGSEGFHMAKINSYDLIIMDYMLPEMNGIETIKHIRSKRVIAPIIMLTVIDDEDNIVNALDAGADDYLSKPFSFDELLARIRALMRREKHIRGDVLTFEGLELDTVKHKAKRDGIALDLTKKEYALLEYFMRNPEAVLTRGMILEHVWDYSTDPFTNTVDVHIRYLRKKMDTGFNKELIHTVHGIGYKLSTRPGKYSNYV